MATIMTVGSVLRVDSFIWFSSIKIESKNKEAMIFVNRKNHD